MSAVPTFNLEAKGADLNKALTDLNTYLSTRSYMEGWSKSSLDATTLARIQGDVSAKKYPHIARWAAHIGFFEESVRATWRVFAVEAPKAVADEDDEEDDEDDDDPFGAADSDDDEETRAMMEKKRAEIEAITARQQARKGKARSNLTIDIKPEDSETDMNEVMANVKAIELDGLKWLGGQLIDVAYGIKKLRQMCQIEDQKN